MSIPFFKTKKEAQQFWGKGTAIVKVNVPKSRGFLQAPEGGEFWISAEYARKLILREIE